MRQNLNKSVSITGCASLRNMFSHLEVTLTVFSNPISLLSQKKIWTTLTKKISIFPPCVLKSVIKQISILFSAKANLNRMYSSPAKNWLAPCKRKCQKSSGLCLKTIICPSPDFLILPILSITTFETTK